MSGCLYVQNFGKFLYVIYMLYVVRGKKVPENSGPLQKKPRKYGSQEKGTLKKNPHEKSPRKNGPSITRKWFRRLI